MFGIIIENPNHYLLMARDWSEVGRQCMMQFGRWFGPGPFTLLTQGALMREPWAWVVGGVQTFVILGAMLGFLYFLFAKRNPLTAVAATVSAFGGTFVDFLRLPFGLRRILAIAKVAAKEAIRGQVLYVFGLFLLPMAFAGWYLPKTPEGTLLYLVGYLNTAITFTILPMAAFLVSMSLPRDIQNKVVQTVATKPVHRLEILVGRIVGYTAIFTVVLALMAGAGLMFLWGQLTPAEREKYWVARGPIFANRMPEDARKFLIENMLSANDRADAARAQAFADGLEQRFPLMFKRREGWDVKGMNVGKEWDGQRWHVPGSYSSQSYAALGFKYEPRDVAVVEDEAGKKLVRVFLECDVFKTNKGDAKREDGVGKDTEKSGVFGEISVRGSGPNYVRSFAADHTRLMQFLVPAELFTQGRVEIYLRCLTGGQFLGVGRSDAYFLSREGSFPVNFLKGMSSLWLKLFFLIVVAVSASAALKGYVAVLATAAVFTLGTFAEFLGQLVDPMVRGKQGGGPLESLLRLYTRANQVTPLDDNIFNNLLLWFDHQLLAAMQKASFFIPNLADLDTVEYVARGIDLPWALVVRNAVFVAAFALPVLFAGHMVLKHRELANA